MTNDEMRKELDRLQQEIAESKRKRSQLEGRKEELLRRLKNEFHLNSVVEAEKEVKRLTSEADKTQAFIDKKFEELKAQYEW